MATVFGTSGMKNVVVTRVTLFYLVGTFYTLNLTTYTRSLFEQKELLKYLFI